MTRMLLTGNKAAAWGARLAEVDYVPAFPITPQTEIIETISKWVATGKIKSRFTVLESEHSMITAAGSAAATGVRVFTASSSQGLLYGMEMIYTTAGWRAPYVLVNVSRGLSAPITLEPDHNDILAARDSGFIQIHCGSCQEVLDAVLLAYKIAEQEHIRLPVFVNQDGFYLSYTREPVEIPDIEMVRKFLPPFDPKNTKFRDDAPSAQGMAVLGGTLYSYFRYQMHLALINAIDAFKSVAIDFKSVFGREYEAVEKYRMDDAQFCFFMTGSFAVKAKNAVDLLRDTGVKIGLVRPILIRPFPIDDICKSLSGIKAVAVIDQNISMGRGGILYTELASALYGNKQNSPLILSYIAGLGGRDISRGEFFSMFNEMQEAVKTGKVPKLRLLFTQNELDQVRKMQNIANP